MFNFAKMGNCSICAIRSKAVDALNPTEVEYLQGNCAEVDMKPGESIIKEDSLSSHTAYLKTGLATIHKMGKRN
jgi:hypothetical protein